MPTAETDEISEASASLMGCFEPAYKLGHQLRNLQRIAALIPDSTDISARDSSMFYLRRALSLEMATGIAVTAIKSYVDGMINDVSDKFGSKSQEFNEARKVISTIYDSSFEYRLLEQVRNMYLHSGGRSFNVEMVVEACSAEVRLNRGLFLSGRVTPRVRSEVTLLSEDPELVSAVSAVTPRMAQMHLQLSAILYSDMRAQVRKVEAYIREAREAGGEPQLLEHKGKNSGIQFMPDNVMLFAQKISQHTHFAGRVRNGMRLTLVEVELYREAVISQCGDGTRFLSTEGL